jgi:F-type H+-transporting ATPase subunit b
MGHTLMRLTRLIPIMIVAACLAVTGSVFAADLVHEADTQTAATAEQVHGAVDDAAAAADANGGGAHAERGLIDFKWMEALYTIIVFAIFFGVLSVFVWPKILASLQAREDKVRGDLQHAEDAANQATTTLEEYKQQLAEAQKQAQQIVDESRGAAQKVAAQLKDEAQVQITQVRERAEADINAAKERAVSEIYDQAGALATQVAGQILRREINADDQATLIRESIDKLRDAGNN